MWGTEGPHRVVGTRLLSGHSEILARLGRQGRFGVHCGEQVFEGFVNAANALVDDLQVFGGLGKVRGVLDTLLSRSMTTRRSDAPRPSSAYENSRDRDARHSVHKIRSLEVT